MASTATSTGAPFGELLRDWRRRRCVSQFDLALEANVSARHLSFIETGRAQPSAKMVLHLAGELDVPLRERNRLLLAAGYAPVFQERALSDPAMAEINAAVQLVLDGHDPYPALTVDRGWALVAHNRAAAMLLEGLPDDLLAPPLNVLRASLHPDGLAPRIRNLPQWRAHLLERLSRQAAVTGDPALRTLRDELAAYPCPSSPEHADDATDRRSDIAVPLRLGLPDGTELAFISAVTTFGTPADITVEELSIESFFPADAATAALLQARARPSTSSAYRR
ncbi:MAG: helix-turn-helix transcriptional regulator [Solirubrobacteraceae bacterium]|nr:helix-turn-helix transcriptional regulator [Solirubrobacteraceae bacterium]